MKFIRNIRYKLDKSLIRGFLMISYLLLLALILIVFFISFVDIFLIKEDSKGFLATFIEYFFLAIKGNSISNSSMTHVIINIILMRLL